MLVLGNHNLNNMDPEHPGPQVGALLEASKSFGRLQVRLLNQILGVGRVMRHSQRGGIQLRHVVHCLFGKRVLIGHQSPRGESNS